jgi:hypothetical protein
MTREKKTKLEMAEGARVSHGHWVEEELDKLRALMRHHGFSLATVPISNRMKLTIATKDGVVELYDLYDEFPSERFMAQIALLVG